VPIPPGGTGKHTHSATSTVTTVIQSLSIGQAGYYAGTAEGLFLIPAAGGPFADLGFPGQNVAAIAVDPAKPQAVWTASTAGTMLSTDGGHTWTRLVNGLVDPGTVSSLVYMGSRLFASDAAGVFEWLPQQGSWARRSAQGSVVSLTAGSDGRVLYVASTTGEVRMLDGAGWQTLGAPGTAHLHSGQAHLALQGVLPFAGRLYAAGTTDGVSASADGGQTWTQLGGDVANRSPAQVVVFHGQLWAATTDGVYRYLLSADVPASVTWWAGLLAAALVIGFLALAVFGLERICLRMGRPQRGPQPGYTYQPQRAPEPAAHTYQPQRQFVGVRPTYEYERPFFGVESYMTTVSPEPAPPQEAPSTETLRWSQQPPTADHDRTRRVPNPSVEPIDRTRRVPPNPSVEPIDRTRRVSPNPSVEPIDRTRRLTDVDPMPPTRVLRPKGGYRRS